MNIETPVAATKEAYEKMSATAAETADRVRTSYSTAIKGAQDYSCKFLEFANENMNAAFDFAHRLSQVKTPSDFVSMATEHAHKQFETLAEQTKQLAALAQKVTVATAEPIKPSSSSQRH
jgi:phasin